MLLDRVAGTISRYSMLNPGNRVGVAVSGGADSVCLLHILRELAPALQMTLTVVHLNHKLRGPESDGDEAFVADLAKSLNLPVVTQSVDLSQIDTNLEQAGRKARHAFFTGLLSSSVDRIATAHTRSDQAETVLYRLIRGSGTAGLAGIRPVLTSGIIRPLLGVDRAEVLAYLAENKLSWREDTSNSDVRFVRNRIRHELLPLLVRDYNPQIVHTLAQMADIAREEESWWDVELDRIGIDGPEVRVSALRSLHPAVQRRVVRRILHRVRGDLRRVDAAHVEAVLTLRSSGTVQLPGGTDAVRSLDVIRFKAGSGQPEGYETAVQAPASVPLPGTSRRLGLQIVDIPSTWGSAEGNSVYNGGGDCLDADRLTGPLVVRNWRPGDVFRPKGRSERKLKVLLHRARVPVWSREGWPVVVSGSTVVWTRRFGVAAGFEPVAATRRIMVISEGECAQP